ncbi:MAG: hypothetical protein ACREP7_23810 [Lysobacter sp.]
MTLRKLTLAATAAFVFAASTVALARPPLTPCQECRIGYNVCMSETGGREPARCATQLSECQAEAGGCPAP